MNQKPRPTARKNDARIVSEQLDRMQDDMQMALAPDEGGKKKTQVKLARSRNQTKITLVFKGSLEDTEERLKQVYQALTGKEANSFEQEGPDDAANNSSTDDDYSEEY